MLTLALAGCGAQMSAADCRAKSWRDRGVDDGMRGRPASAIDDYVDACSDHGIRADRAAWLLGREAGLSTYCTEEGGHGVGESGADYEDACAGRPTEIAFLTGLMSALSLRREQLARDAADLRGYRTPRTRAEAEELERRGLLTPGTRAEAKELQRRAILLQADIDRTTTLWLRVDARLQALRSASAQPAR